MSGAEPSRSGEPSASGEPSGSGEPSASGEPSGSGERSDASAPRVVVLVSAGCHLCADACAIVSSVCAEVDELWSARDLGDLDHETIEKWREFVPVVLIDGEVHDVFRVTPDRLRAALS